MKSALICVFYAILVYTKVSLAADEYFKPTPIPLGEWKSGARDVDGTTGTLQEFIATDAPPTTVAVPAHYWEDALRHSVYLTLVRDKIDQLIAKGSTQLEIRPDQKENDHDLWEKIKTASFDRLNTEEPAILGDITIMSKGRLLEENNGLRFIEDEMSKEKCNDETCNEGVKAYWSVKRIRQRDAETVPGKYHYELTFSVSSQIPKKLKKTYENAVRTFTVREGTPIEKPQYRVREPIAHVPRPQRAIWFHKNIAPMPHRQSKQEQVLDRLFSSWFSDDEPPKRYKQVPYVSQIYPQRSKDGYDGAPTEQYHQKQVQVPYPYKPQPQSLQANSYKYSRPSLGPPVGTPLSPPPVSHSHSPHLHIDLDAIRNTNQFTPPPSPEIKYLPSNVVKTTKPIVLTTPPQTYTPLNNLTQSINTTDMTPTKDPEIITAFTMYSKPKPLPTKMSYFPEHVRPPVFNAPPGVFVTMDKKPFKPMPPLKYVHSNKHHKNRPIDFRPSPQVLDVQFSDPDPLSNAFRPIAMSYSKNATGSSEQADGERRKPIRKLKPPKKPDNIKSHRATTSIPDIITAHSDIMDEMDWANILGAFVKTTPMVSQKINVNEKTTSLPSTAVSLTTIIVQSTPSTTEATTTVSHKPRRTRPPPKFSIPEKVKKHKRVTTTTTGKPHHRRPSQDLTPQATSASTGATKSGWQPTTKIQNATISTIPMSANITNIFTTSTPEHSTAANIAPTTYRPVTTTRENPTTTTSTEAPTTTSTTTTTSEKTTTTSTTPSKINRFRQSTLIIKGTSVKHDKWSSPLLIEKNKTIVEKSKIVSSVSGKFPRRKGSNFQGYISTSKTVDEERNREDHVDHVYNPKLNVISLSTTEATTEAVTSTTPITTQATNDESLEEKEQIEFEDVIGTAEPDHDGNTEESDDTNEDDDVQESKDHKEFIFDNLSKPQNFIPSKKSNEAETAVATITEANVVTVHPVPKNKTKCKKKKNNQTPKANESENEVNRLETTTEKLSTADFFNQIFGMTVDQNETDGNQTEPKYEDNDDDLEDFLNSINKKKDGNDANNEPDDDDEYEEDDKEETENSPFNNDEDNRYPRSAETSYEDYQDRQYSFLELMAME